MASRLLAAPTHAAGWLDPIVAVERFWRRFDTERLPELGTIESSDALPCWRELPDLCDIVQALLRLAPDHRAEALHLARGLRGEPGAALRYALGADDVMIGRTLPLWIAAARARTPQADDEQVERCFPRVGPGCGRIGGVEISWRPGSYGYGEIAYDPPVPRTARCDLPTMLHFKLAQGDLGWRFRKAEDNRWLALVWPQCRYPWWVSGTLRFGQNLDWIQTSRGDVVILELLVDPDEPVTGAAANLLAVALAAKEPGQSTAAVDVLIAAISDTRLDGAALGQALTAALQIEPLKPQRWAKTLLEVGRTLAAPRFCDPRSDRAGFLHHPTTVRPANDWSLRTTGRAFHADRYRDYRTASPLLPGIDRRRGQSSSPGEDAPWSPRIMQQDAGMQRCHTDPDRSYRAHREMAASHYYL